jgi:hypothetical protein
MKTHKAKTFLRAGASLALAVLAVAVAGANLAQAQSCNVEWTGNAGTDVWGTARNWSTDKVPGPTSNVCILTAPSTGSVDATATPSISVNSIQLGQGDGLAFGSGTVTIAESLTSQGYLTLFGTTTLKAASVDMQSGTLVGGGTIASSLTNNDYLGQTNGETVTVTGNYTQTPSGQLNVTFSTAYPPALVVNSNATLSGTLTVTVNLKHPPKPGSTYTAMTFGSLSGEFTSTTVEGGGTVQYTNNSVVVTFQ